MPYAERHKAVGLAWRGKDLLPLPLAFCSLPLTSRLCYIVRSMFHTKARMPTSVLRQSSLCTVCSSSSTLSSSTTVITAEFISGQVCVPRCGSPSVVPCPCTCSKKVKPLIPNWSSMYSTRSVLAWLNTIKTDFIFLVNVYQVYTKILYLLRCKL